MDSTTDGTRSLINFRLCRCRGRGAAHLATCNILAGPLMHCVLVAPMGAGGAETGDGKLTTDEWGAFEGVAPSSSTRRLRHAGGTRQSGSWGDGLVELSLIHISEPTRLALI
eukprot:10288980-Alexandrium_andersonii.AAC.1